MMRQSKHEEEPTYQETATGHEVGSLTAILSRTHDEGRLSLKLDWLLVCWCDLFSVTRCEWFASVWSVAVFMGAVLHGATQRLVGKKLTQQIT
jgi:hypothetical protein